MEGHGASQRLYYFAVIAFVLHHDGVQIERVLQIAHSAERHVDVLIQIVVAIVDDVFQDAYDLVRDAIHANVFANRVLSGKKLLLGVRADSTGGEVGGVIEQVAGGSDIEVRAEAGGHRKHGHFSRWRW